MQKPLQVALLGFGTVGQSVARILTERSELAKHIQLTHIFNRDIARKREPWVSPSVIWTEDVEKVFASRPDAIVEVVGGLEPAGSWIRRALEHGINAITANKQLLAAHAPELLHLAATNGSQLRFEAAVCGGVPVIHGIREGLSGDRLTRVAGILNGTSNYILSQMATGENEPMSVVLESARQLGYAEADPSADIDGDDASAKLVVLAGITFRRHLQISKIPRNSIRPIGNIDFRYAQRLNSTIRQIAMVEVCGDRFHPFVGPALVPVNSEFGRNDGANNLVTISGYYGGERRFSGTGAGGPATAVAVVSDLLTLAESAQEGRSEEWLPAQIAPPPALPHYLRFVVRDRPGIVGSIATSLADQGINLDAVLQEPGYQKDALPFVITVEPCKEVALRMAIAIIVGEDFHSEPPLILPIMTK